MSRVKEAVFPFARFPGVDLLLGPEMRSTGEVMGIDRDLRRRLRQEPARRRLEVPVKGTVFVSVRDEDKERIVPSMRILADMGFRIIATRGTQRLLQDAGHPAAKINKVLEGRPHIVDAIKNGEIQLVFNTTEGAQALADSAFAPPHGPLAQGALLYHLAQTRGGLIQAILTIRLTCSSNHPNEGWLDPANCYIMILRKNPQFPPRKNRQTAHLSTRPR